MWVVPYVESLSLQHLVPFCTTMLHCITGSLYQPIELLMEIDIKNLV